MGCFSWLCTHCNKSIMADFVEHKDVKRRSQAVVLLPEGHVIVGSYDGYGRVGGIDIRGHSGLEMLHDRCWEAIGGTNYRGASEPADDQGIFFDDEEDEEDEEEVPDYIPPDFTIQDVKTLTDLRVKAEELKDYWNMEFDRNRESATKLATIRPVARAWDRIDNNLKNILREFEDLSL